MIKKLLTLAFALCLASQVLAARPTKPAGPAKPYKGPKLSRPASSEAAGRPGFIFKPVVYASYVMTIGQRPVLTFSADEDADVTVWETDASGKNHVNRVSIFAGHLKKGVKEDVKWKSLTLPNGIYNYHIVMTDKAGNSSTYNVPITIDIVKNPNRSLILY